MTTHPELVATAVNPDLDVNAPDAQSLAQVLRGFIALQIRQVK